jgi:peptidoglycan-N-acetylglucosamine deacetylase
MPLNLPEGKTLAVSIGSDFDAQCLWMGVFNRTSPAYMSRGQFGADVAVPRLLELFHRYNLKTTWCTPSHTLLTFTDRCKEIEAAGHEFAAHGVYHETVPSLSPEEERRLFELQLEHHRQVLGKRPRGYRSPAWDFTDHTLGYLEEFGFEWDSSLMGRDFEPYYPRPVTVNWESANTFGPPSRILEIPVSWYLDDFPFFEYIPGIATNLNSTDVAFDRWKDSFDYAREHYHGGVYALTVHPQCIGRAQNIMMFERLIQYMSGFDGVWFATLSEIYDAWAPDERASALPGTLGPPPAG